MTDHYSPLLHTQADLEVAWRHLIRPLGFHRRSLWMLLIDADDRPTPLVTEVTDLPEAPEDEHLDGLGEVLEHFVSEVEASGRWALLLSRPGAHPADGADLAWAAGLYRMLRRRRIPHDVVHLASDVEIAPIPLDDVTGQLRAS